MYGFKEMHTKNIKLEQYPIKAIMRKQPLTKLPKIKYINIKYPRQ